MDQSIGVTITGIWASERPYHLIRRVRKGRASLGVSDNLYAYLAKTQGDASEDISV